jgi:hypothetical protein
MRSILKFTLLAVFCGLFLMQGEIAAQDSGKAVPAENPDKTKKTDKPDKSDKPEKTVDGVAPITLKDLAVDFPDVEGWEREEIQKYPSEELGFSVNYESIEGGRVTIYVYNGGKRNIPDDLSDKILKNELNTARNEIRRVADMGLYQDVKELKNDTVTLGGANGKVKALRTLYNFSANGRNLTSEIYMFAHRNRFIKIRATRPRDKDENGNKAVTSLHAEIDAMFSK